MVSKKSALPMGEHLILAQGKVIASGSVAGAAKLDGRCADAVVHPQGVAYVLSSPLPKHSESGGIVMGIDAFRLERRPPRDTAHRPT